MGKTDEAATEKPPPPQPSIILEGVGWKRRSGFGKYSESVGFGPTWERRRFALTANPAKLNYYSCDGDDAGSSPPSPSRSAFGNGGDGNSNKSLLDESPRGSLDVLNERVTMTATFPGSDASQPTPYAVALKSADTAEKWKFCFDDRETQLVWLVALTDIVSEASVREFNSRILMDKSGHGIVGSVVGGHGLVGAAGTAGPAAGFHRMYEEGDGKMLDLVHTALLSSGALGGGGNEREVSMRSIDMTAIEVVSKSRSLTGRESSIRITNAMLSEDDPAESDGAARVPTPKSSPKASFDGNRREEPIPVEKLYQALAVLALSVLLESCAEMSSSTLWKLVNVVILCICFLPKKPKEEGGRKGGDHHRKVVSIREPEKDERRAAEKDESNGDAGAAGVTVSMVGAELMKARGVPLSDVPLASATGGTGDDADAGEGTTKPEPSPEPEPPAAAATPFDEEESKFHERWAVSSPSVDLTGSWTLIADESFKEEYSAYLKSLGFSGITRKVACSVIARTTEETRQTEGGRELYLKGTNPKGAWERTLTASGWPDFGTRDGTRDGEDYEHVRKGIKTADSEDVEAEAWWEANGTKHRSWLRGGKKYGGGDFESIRYIEEGSDGDVLVCESIFHPTNASKEKAVVTWRFQKDKK